LWDPWRSKLAAWLLKLESFPSLPRPIHTILYLGGAHGTTASHLSEIFPDANIFVIEKSPISFAHLLAFAKRRENLLPILADAQLPERYQADVGVVELLYQDVAQRGQAQIFRENAFACLAREGRGILMLKVRSVTQTRPVSIVTEMARQELARGGLSVRTSTSLAPFSKDHMALWIDAESSPEHLSSSTGPSAQK
jgi:fibrillarin-like pre-rRNA processing protein